MVRRLTAFKAHFTRIERANKRLVDYAPTVATPATVSALEKGLDKLSEQHDKIAEVVEELQDHIEDVDALEELDLETYLDEALERFEANRSLLLDAIKAAGVPPRQPITAPAAGGAGGGGGAGGARKLAVNKSLKPFTLLTTHNPTEFKGWGRQFRGYYRSSNMELLEIPDQQLYLQSCIKPQIFSKISGRITDTTEIFGVGSCMELLMDDFQERWPLFNRRMAFFTYEQAPGQDLSAWVSVLEELASEAEIEDITMEDILIF